MTCIISVINSNPDRLKNLSGFYHPYKNPPFDFENPPLHKEFMLRPCKILHVFRLFSEKIHYIFLFLSGLLFTKAFLYVILL